LRSRWAKDRRRLGLNRKPRRAKLGGRLLHVLARFIGEARRIIDRSSLSSFFFVLLLRHRSAQDSVLGSAEEPSNCSITVER
jgi:hypothetical protein